MKKLAPMLEEVEQVVSRATDLCVQCKKKSEARSIISVALNSLSGAEAFLSDHKRKFIPVRKSIVTLSNTMHGLLDGLETGDINAAEFRQVARAMQSKLLDRYRDSVASCYTLIQRFDDPNANDWQDALAATSVMMNESTGEPMTVQQENEHRAEVERDKKQQREIHYKEREEALVKDIRTLNHRYADLPKRHERTKKPFFIMKYPVIPLLDFGSEQLNKALLHRGYAVHKFSSYIVLDNQTLLGINTDYLKRNGITNPDAYAEDKVEEINSRSSIKYALMSDKHKTNPEDPAILFYWLIPKNRIFDHFKPGSAKDWSLLTFLKDEDYHEEMERLREADEKSAEVEKRVKAQADKVKKESEEAWAKKRAEQKTNDRIKRTNKVQIGKANRQKGATRILQWKGQAVR